MRMLVVAASLGLLASTPAIAAQAAPRPLQPTEKWVVNFDDAQCLASRNYGTRERPLLLGFKSPPLGSVMQLMVVRPAPAGQPTAQVAATVSADGGPPFAASMLAYSDAGSRQQIYRANLPLAQFAAVRSAKTLSIDAGGLQASFALDQMQPLMKVMDECVADLRQAWNIASGGSTLRQPPKGDVPVRFTIPEYPGVVAQGSVRMALLIDEKGGVADCTVIQTSGVAVLDAHSCQMYESSARFKPAIGLDGRPAKSSFVQEVDWGA